MVTQTDTNQFGSKKVSWGLGPEKGPRSFPITFDFSKGTTLSINLLQQVQKDDLEFIQAVFVDNSTNFAELSITDSITGEKLIWPAGSQGYLPFMCGGNPVFTVTSLASELSIPAQLLTFALPAILWSVSGQTGSKGADFSANKPAALANVVATAPANSKRKNISVQNQSVATIQVELQNADGSVSIALLAPGTAANTQGGDWASQTFKGRVRIFATNTTDQVFMHED